MKIKSFILCMLGVFTLLGCQPSEPSYDLYLLIGQSNMAGRGSIEAIDRQTHDRVFMLDHNNQWTLARNPLHFDKPERDGTGLGLTFGIEMAEANPNTRIGLIPCAVGGSPISSWRSGGFYKRTQVHPYNDAIARTKIAQRRGKLKAILWHQGESDSSKSKVPLYKDELIKLAADLRRDLNAPNVPFIVGGLGDFVETRRPQSVDITAILKQAPNFIENAAFVSAHGLTDRGDNLHFNSKSYRELGRRYAQAVQNIQKP